MIDPLEPLKQNGRPPVDGLKDWSSRVTAGLTLAELAKLNANVTPFAKVGRVKSESNASIEIVAILCFMFSTTAVVSCEYRLFA